MIPIYMAGCDHSLAGIDVRQKFAFTKKAAAAAMVEIRALPGVSGCLILSTCNRTELWVHGEAGEIPDLPAVLCEKKGLDPGCYREFFVVREGEEAARHLFRTTSGLKSRILGEDQILAQVKQALQEARNCDCTDPVLETLFRMAVTGAKKVKTGMQMSTANLSAIEQAVSRLKERGVSFSGKECLVIGNGEMGRRAATALLEEGAHVTSTVRQYRSGIVDIPRGCDRINYGDRYGRIPSCDLVVSATSSPNVTIRMEDLAQISRPKAQIFIDLAVPRDIDPAIRELPGVTLYDLDAFSVRQSRELTEQVERAEQLLEEQIREFVVWYEGRDLIPVVRQVGKCAAEDVYWRMGKTVKKLDLPEDQVEELKGSVSASAEKVVEKLLFTIRNEAGIDVFRKCLDAVRTEYGEKE